MGNIDDNRLWVHKIYKNGVFVGFSAGKSSTDALRALGILREGRGEAPKTALELLDAGWVAEIVENDMGYGRAIIRLQGRAAVSTRKWISGGKLSPERGDTVKYCDAEAYEPLAGCLYTFEEQTVIRRGQEVSVVVKTDFQNQAELDAWLADGGELDEVFLDVTPCIAYNHKV